MHASVCASLRACVFLLALRRGFHHFCWAHEAWQGLVVRLSIFVMAVPDEHFGRQDLRPWGQGSNVGERQHNEIQRTPLRQSPGGRDVIGRALCGPAQGNGCDLTFVEIHSWSAGALCETPACKNTRTKLRPAPSHGPTSTSTCVLCYRYNCELLSVSVRLTLLCKGATDLFTLTLCTK